MIHHGYDPKSKDLFSWDGDFKYLGKSDNPPEKSFIVEEDIRLWTEMAGCQFLSGYRRECVTYLSAGTNSVSAYGNNLTVKFRWTNCYDWKKVVRLRLHSHPTAPICVGGYVADDKAEIAELCKLYPSSTIYVCQLVEELAAFGVLVANIQDKEKPRRTSLCVPNKELLGGQGIEFDEKLNGDAFGRMADIINHGSPVLNEIMTCPGISPFYGKVLTRNTCDLSTFIVRCDAVDKYFPCEPISAKMYAATSVPVEMKNTEMFRKDSGCDKDKVNIMVASDYVPGLQAFMTFYKIMSALSFVGVAEFEDFPKNIPVFRYNRGYRDRGRN